MCATVKLRISVFTVEIETIMPFQRLFNFYELLLHAQWAHDANTTSAQRRCNVMTLHRRLGDVVLTSCDCWVIMCLYELILPAVIVECGYLQTLESDSATWLKISFMRWTYIWLLKICSTTIPIYQLYMSAIETLQYEGHVPTGIIVCDIVLKWCIIFRMFISDRYQSILDWFIWRDMTLFFL